MICGFVLMVVIGCLFAAAQLGHAAESNEHIHIKLHVPQIIKKHTHTRTIYKHHFVKPKLPKSLVHSPILHSVHTLSASPSTIQSSGSSKSTNPSYGGVNNLWRPSASEYRASELSFVPKKIKVNKTKNPFKILEALAEAQAEGHDLRPHVIKKVRPTLPHDDQSDTSDYVPDYMLVDTNNPRYGQDNSYSGFDDDSGLGDSSSKADLIYVAPKDKYKKKHGNSFLTSRDFVTPIPTLKKKTKVPTFDWNAAIGSSSSISDSDYEPEPRHQSKKNKSRKPKRLAPTLGSSEEHINHLQRVRKHNPITNYTKYKNRLNAASSLNTSI